MLQSMTDWPAVTFELVLAISDTAHQDTCLTSLSVSEGDSNSTLSGKSDFGNISKKILDRVNAAFRSTTAQWGKKGGQADLDFF